MRSFINDFFLVIVASSPMVCFGQGTLQIRFDGFPLVPNAVQHGATQYVEFVYFTVEQVSRIRFLPIAPSDQFKRNGSGVLSHPDNGTAFIQAVPGDSVAFRLDDGTLFGMVAADLAAFHNIAPDFTVNFIGYRPDGSTIATSFSGTGIDFRTVYFSPDWSSGLARVEIPNDGWSLDNLVVSVPEPGTGALLVIGTLTFLFWRMKR